jgi:hypothetical protein
MISSTVERWDAETHESSDSSSRSAATSSSSASTAPWWAVSWACVIHALTTAF